MMNRFVVSLALGLVVCADTSLLAQPRGPRRGEGPAINYGWLSSLEEGKAKARQSGKPLMVVIRCVP